MRKRFSAVVLLVVLATLLPACKVARVGASCRPTEGPARNSTHVLLCQKGRWQRSVTLGQAAEFIMSPWAGLAVSNLGGEIVQPVPSTLPAQTLHVTTRAGQPAANMEIRLNLWAVVPFGQTGPPEVNLTFTTDANGVIEVPTIEFGRTERIVAYWYGTHPKPILSQVVRGGRFPTDVVVLSGDGQEITAGATPAPMQFEIRDYEGHRTAEGRVEVTGADPAMFRTTVEDGLVTVAPLGPLVEAGSHRVGVTVYEPFFGIGEEYEMGWNSAGILVNPGPTVDIFSIGDGQEAVVNTQFSGAVGAVGLDGYGNVTDDWPTFTVVPGPTGASGTLVSKWFGVEFAVVANHLVGSWNVRIDVGAVSKTLTLTNIAAPPG